jgi:hypothetical protein
MVTTHLTFPQQTKLMNQGFKCIIDNETLERR